MTDIRIVSRELTAEETSRMNSGFDELSIEEGVESESSERISFVAVKEGIFVGCASGLAFKNGGNYSAWFFVTDLYVEQGSRSRGLGSDLLLALEAQFRVLRVRHAFLWTSGDKALRFYQRKEYREFAKMENWYSDGSSRIGLRKDF